MPTAVTNQDCCTLSDLEKEDLANISSEPSEALGIVSKESDKWVTAFVSGAGSKVNGFSFATLERIGGTPCVLIGPSVVSEAKPAVAKALVTAIRKKAKVAFPDEDVIFACCVDGAVPAEIFEKMNDPQPCASKPGGEERAWGRRLAKRLGVDDFSDTKMVGKVSPERSLFEWPGAQTTEEFRIKSHKGSITIAWAWAMVEMLDSY